MGNAALAFFTGLGSGYLQGQELQEKKARQAKIDQREDDEHQARMAPLKKQQLGDSLMAQAAKPMVAASNGMAKAEWADDRDVGQKDGATVENGGLAPIATANTPDAQRSRAASALYGIGDFERGDKIVGAGKSAALADIQLKEAQAAEADKAFRRKLGTAMFSGGHSGLAELATTSEFGPMAGKKVQAVVSQDGKSVTYNLIGQDGALTPVPGLTFSNDQEGVIRAAYMLDRAVPTEARIEGMRKDAKEAREGRETDAKIRLSNAHAGYYEAGSRLQDAKADGSLTPEPAQRMSEADKLALQGIGKQRDAINTAIIKAKAEGMWDEKSPNAVQLRKQLAGLGIREQQLMSKYGDSAPLPDPLGLRGKPAAASAPAGQPSTRVTPSEQAARDKDRVGILTAELAKAQKAVASAPDEESRARAQTDVDSLMKELKRAGVTATTAQTAPSLPAPAPATAPTPSASPPTAARAPAMAEASPADKAGQRLDAARAALKQLRATAPGLAAGRAAIEQRAQQVESARAELAAAEAEYQRLMGANARPYFAGQSQAAQKGI